MQAGSSQITVVSVRGRDRRRGHDLDGRTANGRRARKIMAELVEARGGMGAIGAAMMLRVRTAAELVVACEVMRDRMLAGDARATAFDVVRLQGCADRALRRLDDGKPRPAPAPTSPLAGYLAGLDDGQDDEEEESAA
jgi:hypothetical protein